MGAEMKFNTYYLINIYIKSHMQVYMPSRGEAVDFFQKLYPRYPKCLMEEFILDEEEFQQLSSWQGELELALLTNGVY